MTLLAFNGVHFGYPGWPSTLDGIDFDLREGEVHCLVGRSGSGKTTLLKLAAGLLEPSSGAVTLRGSPPSRHRADIGFVFQSPTLLEWLRVIDNVLLPIALKRTPSADDRARAAALLAQLGLEGYALRYPRQLSGGQQSRVALARALVLDPPLLVLDEPFAALDAMTREELQRDLAATMRRRNASALFVTHDIGEAVFLGDRVTLLHAGVVAATVTIELPHPRADDARYSPAFVAHARDLRAAMEHAHRSGAQSQAGGMVRNETVAA
jgi:NitT/TauT family transport system ATP-binding protein